MRRGAADTAPEGVPLPSQVLSQATPPRYPSSSGGDRVHDELRGAKHCHIDMPRHIRNEVAKADLRASERRRCEDHRATGGPWRVGVFIANAL